MFSFLSREVVAAFIDKETLGERIEPFREKAMALDLSQELGASKKIAYLDIPPDFRIPVTLDIPTVDSFVC